MTIVGRAQSHITIDETGTARIDATRIKVIEIAKALRANHHSVPHVLETFQQLTTGQIHAALAYYYDHQPTLDTLIERELAEFDAARAAAPMTPGYSRMKSQDKVG